ncbi:MAG: hypothetical protein IJX04_11690 [Oscillospiraceae bacterium]|nr:hypothetical protein [Oscillospiraceae bacterium]
MIMDLGIYQLDIDLERTAAFYAQAPGIGCDCDGCRNYEKAVSHLPSPVLELFQRLGIDPAKPAEVYANCAPTKESIFYGGWYHICGTIRKGRYPWIKIDERHSYFDEACRVRLAENFSVYLNDKIYLLEEGFPTPVLQLEIEFTLPWVLPIPNTYP